MIHISYKSQLKLLLFMVDFIQLVQLKLASILKFSLIGRFKKLFYSYMFMC